MAAITSAEVIAWMGITQNLEPVESITAAVIDYINSLPSTHRAFEIAYPVDPVVSSSDYSAGWGPRQTLAALMLAISTATVPRSAHAYPEGLIKTTALRYAIDPENLRRDGEPDA